MTIPTKYAIPSESIIANYDFTDIATATGYVNFQPMKCTDQYVLQESTLYSDLVFTYAESGSDTNIQVLDLDFDLLFNLPRTIRGLGYVSVPIVLFSEATAKVVHGFVIATLNKIDENSVETQIVTNTSDTFIYTSNSSDDQERANFTIDLDVPLTLIKKGETLRLTIEGWVRDVTGSNNVGLAIGHDPQNRARTDRDSKSVTNSAEITFSTHTSRMQFSCPFRIDI